MEQAGVSQNRQKYFRQKPDPKLPNYELPIPDINDFYDENYFIRDQGSDLKDENGNIVGTIPADNALFLKGTGNYKTANILFLSGCPTEEEVDSSTSPPCLLKSGSGALFRRLCLINGINIDKEYYTTLSKYALPRKYQLKPKAKDIAYCSPLLQQEINLVQPRIIVCIGKEAVNFILGLNIGLKKLEEGWFFSKRYHAMVYIMCNPVQAYYKPEYYDKLDAELKVLSKYYIALASGKTSISEVPLNYQFINTYEKLDTWLKSISSYSVFAVDCEWRGMNFIDGNLRSIQFSWKEGYGAYLHLFDENNNYGFDVPYEQVKLRLQEFFNQPNIRYYGHNFCADAVWMKNHLGLEVYGRCILDTQYAFQTFNEYEDLGLKKLAAKYTDLGKYDIELILYLASQKGKLASDTYSKNVNSSEEDYADDMFLDIKDEKIDGNDDDGYGTIPTDILYPYGVRDADATFRLAKVTFKGLIDDGTLDYYVKIRNPYVTDGFTSMMEAGIPFDQHTAEKVRLVYLYCHEKLEEILRLALRKDAETMLRDKIESVLNGVPNAEEKINKINSDIIGNTNLSFEQGVSALKTIIKNKSFLDIVPYYKHLYFIDDFNPSSAPHKTNWLFNLKKYTPIKTTKTTTGNPLDWDRVLMLPKEDQKQYTPAVDKDTLKVYADRGDNICLLMLQKSAIFTVIKTFLKGNDGGLQKFISKDGKIHASFAMTKSGRPRTFKPNILNIPRYVTDYIKNGFKACYIHMGCTSYEEIGENGKPILKYDFSSVNDEQFLSDINRLRNLYSISETISKEDIKFEELRNCFRSKPGEYFYSADLKTAEIFAIAYLAGDDQLINALTGPDLQFAYKKVKSSDKPKLVRIAYIDNIVQFSDKAKDPALLTSRDDPDLLRDENGDLVHPSRDLHWEAVENMYVFDTPREKLDKEKTRNACGKPANFSIPYGASSQLLERNIEIATNEKPTPGTGDRLREAYNKTKPQVAKFLIDRENEVEDTGFYLSPTGYKRHYKLPNENSDLPKFIRDKIVAGLKRENRNIGMQSLVADTLALAVVSLDKKFRELNLKSRIVCPLYDAIYCVGPWYEIIITHKLIKKCFSLDVGWNLKGGILHFQTDHETGESWGSHLSSDEQKLLVNKALDYWNDKEDNTKFEFLSDISIEF